MRENGFALPLFKKDAIDSRSDQFIQRHIGQAAFRKGRGEKPGQFPARLYDRDRFRPLAGRPGFRTSLRLID